MSNSRSTYCTISGRIGALKTAGRGCEAPLGLPSAEAIVTVGRDAIVVDGNEVEVVVVAVGVGWSGCWFGVDFSLSGSPKPYCLFRYRPPSMAEFIIDFFFCFFPFDLVDCRRDAGIIMNTGIPTSPGQRPMEWDTENNTVALFGLHSA